MSPRAKPEPVRDRTAAELTAAAAARDSRAVRIYGCPLCGVGRGEPCVHDGRPVTWTHPARWSRSLPRVAPS